MKKIFDSKILHRKVMQEENWRIPSLQLSDSADSEESVDCLSKVTHAAGERIQWIWTDSLLWFHYEASPEMSPFFPHKKFANKQ